MEDKMEESSDRREMRRSKKGGLITMPFIIATAVKAWVWVVEGEYSARALSNESLEKVAGYALVPNMILYLIKDYHMSVAKGTNILFYWQAATNFTPILAAFVADSYLGRFLIIGFASICSLLVTLSLS
ncbi:hypothetical protein GOBAR_AA20561 [Gossypium barbadense]|uniref:Uncharacterized protein n=1 Tax=Gossypium barbadense TaxID=3634 RepID=A0A2P5X9U6_GOSBA|nr:hypothetical protein GOBAR_AA20561 [Gossypium barbadense]